MTKLNKFDSIEQFRNVIKQVRDYAKRNTTPLPVLTFQGTVKLHGTNGGIGYNTLTDELWAQSRERIITPFDDNAGFAKFVEQNKDVFKEWMRGLAAMYVTPCVMVYGEWAGQSIQKGVGITNIEKSFFVFRVKVQREEEVDNNVAEVQLRTRWEDISYHVPRIQNLYNIQNFKTWRVDIDFSRPEETQNTLVDLTLEVENECPVAKQLGFSGIGEGIVWYNQKTGLTFKTKGEKHSASKVKTLKKIAAVDLEKMESIREFVDSTVTDNRLNQGIAKLGEMGLEIDIKNMGAFLKWIGQDVLKEEMDVINASCFDKKELMPKINQKAKDFFIKYLDQMVGIQS